MHRTAFLLFVFVVEWESAWFAPVPMRMVDLTHIFDNTTLNWPTVRAFKSNQSIMDMPGLRVVNEEFSSSTHVGTHMDAPCHFVQYRHTVPEILLDRLVAPAAVVDIKEKVALDTDYELETEDLEQWENTTGQLLNGVILLVRSGWSKYWSNRTAYIGNPDNNVTNLHFPGVSALAANWLVKNRDVYGVGVETLSLDHGPSTRFRTHTTLYDKNIYGLENLDSLDDLPLYGATLHVMPMKLGGACGAPTRVIATFPDIIFGPTEKEGSEKPSFHEVIRFA